MTNQEAIYRIQDHMRIHRLYEPNAVLINEALNEAIKALHRREPKKVDNIHGTSVSAMGNCPSCERVLNTGFLPGETFTDFCYHCGQAVKWR